MSVTVDREPLSAEALGLRTVGQVLAHLQRDKRLVVQLLIDGEEPDLAKICHIKQTPVTGHTLFIETADPRRLSMQVLDQLSSELRQAEQVKAEVVELLGRSNIAKAMEKLGTFFRTWSDAHDSVLKTTQLLRIDLESVHVAGGSLADVLVEFTKHLREIRSALEQRDYVLLNDVLQYETAETGEQWQAILQALRETIAAIR